MMRIETTREVLDVDCLSNIFVRYIFCFSMETAAHTYSNKKGLPGALEKNQLYFVGVGPRESVNTINRIRPRCHAVWASNGNDEIPFIRISIQKQISTGRESLSRCSLGKKRRSCRFAILWIWMNMQWLMNPLPERTSPGSSMMR